MNKQHLTTAEFSPENLLKVGMHLLKILEGKGINEVKYAKENNSRKGYSGLVEESIKIEQAGKLLQKELATYAPEKYLGDISIVDKQSELTLCHEDHVHFLSKDRILTELIIQELRKAGYQYDIKEIKTKVLTADNIASVVEVFRDGSEEEQIILQEAITWEPDNLPIIENYFLQFENKPEELLKPENQKFIKILDELGGISTLRLFLKLGKSSLEIREVTLRILYSITYYTEFLDENRFLSLKRELFDYLTKILNYWPKDDKAMYQQVATVLSEWRKMLAKSHRNDYKGLTKEDVVTEFEKIKLG